MNTQMFIMVVRSSKAEIGREIMFSFSLCDALRTLQGPEYSSKWILKIVVFTFSFDKLIHSIHYIRFTGNVSGTLDGFIL